MPPNSGAHSALSKVVVNPISRNDDAVKAAPVPLPTPALPCSRRIPFDVRSCSCGGQWLTTEWTPRRRSSPEAAATFTRLQVRLHCDAYLLLDRTIRKVRPSLVPHGEDRCFATGVTVGVNTIAKPAMAEIVCEVLVATFAGSDVLFSGAVGHEQRHPTIVSGSATAHPAFWECGEHSGDCLPEQPLRAPCSEVKTN